MPPLWNDLLSMLPSFSSPTVSPLPTAGSSFDSLPESIAEFSQGYPTVIACVRHCGCPFAQKEVNSLAELANSTPELRVVIVCMAEENDAKLWFERIGGSNFKKSFQIKLIADPTRETYAKLGIGHLPVSELFSSEMMANLKALKEVGIVNTETVRGSNRWQNSGGFALDAEGIVRWQHVAIHAVSLCQHQSYFSLKTCGK